MAFKVMFQIHFEALKRVSGNTDLLRILTVIFVF